MAVETVTLVKDHKAALGIGYLLASVAVGFVVRWLGNRVARLTSSRPC